MPSTKTWFILFLTLACPGTAWVMGLGQLVLAPPWTFITNLLYLPLLCLGLPVAVVAYLLEQLSLKSLFTIANLTVLLGCSFLVILGEFMPTGMTSCEEVLSVAPYVHYDCVSTSSDDTTYEYHFKLKGLAGWPLVRLVDPSRN